MQPVIEVNNISKKYHLGQYEPYQTLRDAISRVINPANIFTKIKQTGKTFDKNEFWALRDISFSVNKGQIVGIIGRNGAGKSTLLKILSRITRPTIGEINISGRIASMLEVGTGFSPELTGRENIFLNGAILGMDRGEIIKKFDKIVDFGEIEKFIDTPVKYYSSGMYMRLAFSVAAHLEPDILLVDEVLAVGDSDFQKKCLSKMEEITKNEGRTILFVSHNLISIEKLCQKTILLEVGQIKEVGETKDVINSYLKGGLKDDPKSSFVFLKPKENAGNIRFTGIKVSNLKGSKIVKSGEGLRVVLQYSSDLTAEIKDVRIVVNIISEFSGQLVLCLDSNVPVKTIDKGLKPSGEIICETENVDLIEGKYFMNINFHIQGTSVDNVQNAFSFEVKTNIQKYNYKIHPDSSVCSYLAKYSFKQ